MAANSKSINNKTPRLKTSITLAEVESQLRKASQAAGLGWGLAEEAGKCARFLAAFALPGPELMLAQLQNLQNENHGDWFPQCQGHTWHGTGPLLCPIASGAALADRADILIRAGTIKLGRTAYPLLLAAMTATAAETLSTSFSFHWDKVTITIFGQALLVEGDTSCLSYRETANITCGHAPESMPHKQTAYLAYEIDCDSLVNINALAHRTYAPATEESRSSAGAGITDND